MWGGGEVGWCLGGAWVVLLRCAAELTKGSRSSKITVVGRERGAPVQRK